MLRRIAAVLAGLLVCFGLAITVGTWVWVGYLGRNCLPTLIGGGVAGFVARRRGWLVGLLVAGILEAFGLWFWIWAFRWAMGVDRLISVWGDEWWFVLATLLAGAGGGCLGERLAGARLRRSGDK